MSKFLNKPNTLTELDKFFFVQTQEDEEEKQKIELLKCQIENMMKDKNMNPNTFYNPFEPLLYRSAKIASINKNNHFRVITKKGELSPFNVHHSSGRVTNWGIYHALNDMIIFYYYNYDYNGDYALNIQQYAPIDFVYYFEDVKDINCKNKTIISKPIH